MTSFVIVYIRDSDYLGQTVFLLRQWNGL